MGLTGLKSRKWKGYIPFWRFLGRIPFLVFPGFCRLPVLLCSLSPASFPTSNGQLSLSHMALEPQKCVSGGSKEPWFFMSKCRKNSVRGKVIDKK